jgi:hypothetical protein
MVEGDSGQREERQRDRADRAGEATHCPFIAPSYRVRGMTDRCQCSPTCTAPPLKGKPFCKNHIRRCPHKSLLTGWEPSYSPSQYNGDRRIQDTHNCFAYAIGAYEPPDPRLCDTKGECNVKFHQPGNRAGYEGFSASRKKRCPDIVARVLGDNPAISLSTFDARCPPKTSKIAFAVDPARDYHVWRQDSNGYWSDKHGSQPVGNRDASGRLQYNPALANRNYDHYDTPLNYTDFCGFMCVPREGAPKASRSAGGSRRHRGQRSQRRRTRRLRRAN